VVSTNLATQSCIGCSRAGKPGVAHWEPIWQLNPGALRAVNKGLETPSMIAIKRGLVACEQVTQKLSWDDLIADHEALRPKALSFQRSELLNQLQVSRKFAEEQCESGLSSALFIPGVIDIVKNFIFFEKPLIFHTHAPDDDEHTSDDDEDWHWHWEENGDFINPFRE